MEAEDLNPAVIEAIQSSLLWAITPEAQSHSMLPMSPVVGFEVRCSFVGEVPRARASFSAMIKSSSRKLSCTSMRAASAGTEEASGSGSGSGSTGFASSLRAMRVAPTLLSSQMPPHRAAGLRPRRRRMDGDVGLLSGVGVSGLMHAAPVCIASAVFVGVMVEGEAAPPSLLSRQKETRRDALRPDSEAGGEAETDGAADGEADVETDDDADGEADGDADGDVDGETDGDNSRPPPAVPPPTPPVGTSPPAVVIAMRAGRGVGAGHGAGHGAGPGVRLVDCVT